MGKKEKDIEAQVEAEKALPDPNEEAETAPEQDLQDSEGTNDEEVKAPEKKKARILVDCHLGKINQVIELAEDEMVQAAGMVDDTPEAVAYAESIQEAG